MDQSDGASAPRDTDVTGGAARRSAGEAAAEAGTGTGGIDGARVAQPAAPDAAARGSLRNKRAPSFEPAGVSDPTGESTKATSSSHPNNDAAPRRTGTTGPQGSSTVIGLLFVLIACVIATLLQPTKTDATRATLRWHFNSVTKKSPFHKVLSKCCMAPGDGKVRAFHFISDSHDNNLKAAEEYARSMHKGATLITDVPNSVQAMHDKRIVRGGCNVVFVRVADKVDLTLAHHLKGMRDGQDEETLSLACTAFVFSSEGSDRVPHHKVGVLGTALAEELGHFGPHTRLYNIFYTVRLPDIHRA